MDTIDLNLNGITWRIGKYSDNRIADKNDPYAWAFPKDMKGKVYPEAEALYNAVTRYGKVYVNGFKITLEGQRSQLLIRRAEG